LGILSLSWEETVRAQALPPPPPPPEGKKNDDIQPPNPPPPPLHTALACY